MHISLSPCVGICRLDDATGYCVGCGRTGEEIAAWSTAGPGGRRAIWVALPARLQSLGVRVRRLPWMAADVRGFVVRTLREGDGEWMLAAPGASASFPCRAEAGREIRSRGEVVEAVGSGARLRLRCGGKVRAFALDDAAAPAAKAERIVLAVQVSQPSPPARRAGTGPHLDRDAILPDDRALPLCVVDADAQGAWWGIRHAEAAWVAPAGTAALAGELAGAHGEVVIETALGRIEVPIALARLGAGSHAGPGLPEGFVPAAVFQPRL